MEIVCEEEAKEVKYMKEVEETEDVEKTEKGQGWSRVMLVKCVFLVVVVLGESGPGQCGHGWVWSGGVGLVEAEGVKEVKNKSTSRSLGRPWSGQW